MATKEDIEFYRDAWKYNGCSTPIYAIVIIGIISLLCSCATKKDVEYVDREVVRYEAKMQHDSFIDNTHDSVYQIIFKDGDTVYNTKYVEKIRMRDRVVMKTDTCWRDSVASQVKETTVEKQIIPKWCYYSLAVCVLFIIFAFVKLVRWLQTI